MKKTLILNTLIIILLGSSIYSQEPKVIGEGTTKKGQKVLILDDGTWKDKPKEIFKIPNKILQFLQFFDFSRKIMKIFFVSFFR